MKHRSICLMLGLMLMLSPGSFAHAADIALDIQAIPAADSLAVNDAPYYLVNDVAITDPSMEIYKDTTYVSLQNLILAVYPDATITSPTSKTLVSASGLTMTVGVGDNYVEANGRCLPVPHGVRTGGGHVLLPIRTLAQVLGGHVVWNADSGISALYSGTPIASGDTFYNADDVYWLSRIINAESGSEPFSGKLAVGTVVLNRVNAPQFPNTIHGVIFDRRGGVWQFTPAGSGSVYRDPNPESVLAAKLCLEGAREGSNSLYFVNLNVSPNCWARRNRPYVATIGHHTFYA